MYMAEQWPYFLFVRKVSTVTVGGHIPYATEVTQSGWSNRSFFAVIYMFWCNLLWPALFSMTWILVIKIFIIPFPWRSELEQFTMVSLRSAAASSVKIMDTSCEDRVPLWNVLEIFTTVKFIITGLALLAEPRDDSVRTSVICWWGNAILHRRRSAFVLHFRVSGLRGQTKVTPEIDDASNTVVYHDSFELVNLVMQ